MTTQRDDMKKLLALYRDGRLSEEELLARLATADEGANSRQGDDAPERRELAEVLDGYRAAEASGAETIAAWAESSPDPRLAGALRVVAAREAAHAAVLERRVRELGREPSARIPSWLERYNEALLADNACDEERLTAVVGRFPDIQAALAPLRERIDSLEHDPLTRELLRAIAQDEEATLRWMHAALAECKRRGA
jgi:bacterioferritin (cytochrome b1)